MQFKHKKNFRNKIKSEINVTPFVDVMLVLLIVFMITVPIMHSGIEIELPEIRGEKTQSLKNINITINKNGQIFLEQEEIKRTALIEKTKALLAENAKLQIFIYADKNINYGQVMDVFAALRQAMIYNVTLVTEE